MPVDFLDLKREKGYYNIDEGINRRFSRKSENTEKNIRQVTYDNTRQRN